MNLYKRPEKELDPDKLPGQIVNRPPAHLSGTLAKEIDAWMGVSTKDRVLEAISKSRGDYLHLIYELWQEDVIPEAVYMREIKKERKRGPCA